MISSDVPESPERVRRVRWRPWKVYMRSSRGKRPREQQWCRGNQEQLARKSEALRRVEKNRFDPLSETTAASLFLLLCFEVRFLHGIPYNHLTNIPDYNRPLYLPE